MAVVLLLPGIMPYAQLQVVADDLDQLHKFLAEEFGSGDVARLLIQQFNPAVQHDLKEQKSVDEALGEQDGTLDEAAIAAWKQMAFGGPRGRGGTSDGGNNRERSGGNQRSSGAKIPTEGYPEWFPNECPNCNANLGNTDNFYDNRQKINDGDYKAASPWFKCVNCEKGFWPPDSFKGGNKSRGKSRSS